MNERKTRARRHFRTAATSRAASRCTSTWPRIRTRLVAGALLVIAVPASPVPLPAAHSPPVAAAIPFATLVADSTRGLPFLPAPGPGQRFSISSLTRHYERDLNVLTSPSAAARERQATRDLAWLDRYASRPTPPDTTNARRVDQTGNADANLTPAERKAAEPAKPPVHVGIPSPVAVAGSLAGGLVLLVKLIAGLAR